MKLTILVFAAPVVAFFAFVLFVGGRAETPTTSEPTPAALTEPELVTEPAELVGVDAQHGRAPAAAAEPDPVHAPIPLTPLEAKLALNPESPLGLLPPEEAAKYLPTRENLVAWIESVDALSDIDTAAVEWTDDLAFVWGVCQEELALRTFVVGHADRELARWTDRDPSVALVTELEPCRAFLARHVVGDDVELWSLVSDYSDEVANKIRGEGAEADRTDDEPSRWVLFAALRDAGAPSFEAAVEILKTPK
tara:strand:- start:1392 stop:2144 length:753 start_codon:yes stop_codon:yes gene_type:complete